MILLVQLVLLAERHVADALVAGYELLHFLLDVIASLLGNELQLGNDVALLL